MGRLKADLEIHIKKAHSKECKITPESRIEKQNYESQCDLCKKQFKNRNQLVEHWEEDHETHIYICIHLECRTKYICQKSWKEHMKKNHGIGLNCPQCNEFYFFEDQLEEHLEEHIEREEYIEPNGFQCEECYEFFSRYEAIKHKNDGECNRCGKELGCGTKVIEHMREHERRELEIEPHRGTQALCADTLDIGTPNKSRQRFTSENCNEEETDEIHDEEETDEIHDEENKKELKETNIQIQKIRPHVPIDGDKNERNDDIDVENNGKNYETDKIDEENNVEEIEIELEAKTQVIRPHVPIPNYSSQEDKTGLESVKTTTNSTQNNNSESAVSHEDNLGIKAVTELEEKIHKL